MRRGLPRTATPHAQVVTGTYYLYRTDRADREIGYVWLGDPVAKIVVIVDARWESTLGSSWDLAIGLLWRHGYNLAPPTAGR